MKADYFITLDKDKKIVLMTEAIPEHELTESQMAVTYDEYRFLKACHGDLFKAQSLLHEIKKKIKNHGHS